MIEKKEIEVDELTTEEILDFLYEVVKESELKNIHVNIYKEFLKDCAVEIRLLKKEIKELRLAQENQNWQAGKH